MELIAVILLVLLVLFGEIGLYRRKKGCLCRGSRQN